LCGVVGIGYVDDGSDLLFEFFYLEVVVVYVFWFELVVCCGEGSVLMGFVDVVVVIIWLWFVVFVV